MAPCVIFEDEHLLAVHKPAGWNTHAPSPYAGQGIYDWLKNREPRWATLAIIHRLDKETSGIILFGKTPLANRSLTEQFTQRRVHKRYLLLTHRPVPRKAFTVTTHLVRVGDKYQSRPVGEPAETRFIPLPDAKFEINTAGLRMVAAEPMTGRTHQIRVHAAENGFPILGDTLYGGAPSSRVFLHASEITITHPATHATLRLTSPLDFDADARQAIRTAIINPQETNAFRLIHGAADGYPGWYVDRLGHYLLSQSATPPTTTHHLELARLAQKFTSRAVYYKNLSRQVRQISTTESSPQLLFGEPASGPFEILENGVRYELSFTDGYSVGLFLDQRDNRRRLLTGHIAAKFPLPDLRSAKAEVLNVFSYTCGFSVCAALGGARTTSLDLSKKYLEWGRRNFQLNGLDPAAHDFIYGDAFDWLRRLAKKGRQFEVVVLDPPTFSKSKQQGVFRVEKDLGALMNAAIEVLKPGGVILVSANTASWPAEKFIADLETTVKHAGRDITDRHYIPQPPDFPVSRDEPAYLKTMWLRLG